MRPMDVSAYHSLGIQYTYLPPDDGRRWEAELLQNGHCPNTS